MSTTAHHILISQEGIDYVVCQICGVKRKKVNNAHLRMHNLTPSEYLDLYPDAVLTCESTRKKLSEANKGKPLSNEHKRNLSKSLKEGIRTGQITPLSGEKNPMFGQMPWNKGIPCSEETKQKISEIAKEEYKTGKRERLIGEKHRLFGKHHTKETRKKISQAQKGEKGYWFGKSMADDTKQRMSEAQKGEKNHFFGKTPSDEHKKKISDSHKEAYRTGRLTVSKHIGRGNAYFRPDLNQSFRSNWEANYARILNHQGIQWQYEKSFDLGFTTYFPDFLLSGLRIIEVKGFMTVQSQLKIDLFQDLLHSPLNLEYNFILIDELTYKQLEQEYKSLIPLWETKGDVRLVKDGKGFKFVLYKKKE